MKNRNWTDNWTGLGGQPTDHTLSNGLDPDEAHYLRADLFSFSNLPCSPSITGASKMIPLANTTGKAEWGKMDFYKDRGMEGWTPRSDESLLVCHGGGTPPVESVYTFCSEKDGKTVVICIAQMKDNPDLAKQIFETFRWTE